MSPRHLRQPQEGLPGGFLGVDVFYVISGYVVSHSLLGPRGRDNSAGVGHALLDFYARRLKRLVPALSLMLVVVVLLLRFIRVFHSQPFSTSQSRAHSRRGPPNPPIFH